jgi:hypothetical protein
LIERIMDAIVGTLKTDRAFRAQYNALTGTGVGERNSLSGLPPLGLFLKTLGIRLFSPWKVALKGSNPFPWPVEVKYKGLSIYRGVEETQITFPDGQTAIIDKADPCVVEWDKRT